MAGNIGIWANYHTGKFEVIPEHETWIRAGNNAEKIGVPDDIYEDVILGNKPVKDRNKMILELLDKTSLMRIREHGNLCTFEFSNRNVKKPLDMIAVVAKYLQFGPLSSMWIVNFAERTEVNLTYEKFLENYKKKNGGDIKKLAESIEMKIDKSSLRNLFEGCEMKIDDGFDFNHLRNIPDDMASIIGNCINNE